MEFRATLLQASGDDVLRWFASGAQEVSAHRTYLNQINVFPVADGDTGSNLSATLRAMAEKPTPNRSFAGMLQSISRSGLENARGNSGVIFAAYVDGLARESGPYERVGAGEFAGIAQRAVRHLYRAVEQPREGTLMSVIRDWAESLQRNAERFSGFPELFAAAYAAAHESLEKTKEQLAVLRRYRVVDSGAAGFVRFLEGINRVFSEDHTTASIPDAPAPEILPDLETTLYRYCTEASVELRTPDPSPEAIAALRARLSPLGDSLILTPYGSRLKLHLHTDHPDRVMEILEAEGQILEQKADDLQLQTALRARPRGGIGLLTDSIADLPDAFLREHHISVLPMGVLVRGTAYLDKVTLSLRRLFTEMDRPDDYPTSSQPEPARIQALLRERLEAFDSLIVLSVAEPLSGTYRALVQAAAALETPEHRITVINTRQNSGAQGLLVRHAALLLKEGRTHDQIVSAVETRLSCTHIYVCLNTLAYAVRGGRVPNTVGKLGMLVGLRPIMTLDARGHGAAFGAAFSQKGLTRRILRLVKRAMRRTGIEAYAIVHGANPTLAETYREQLVRLTRQEPAFITEISSAVALHAGPGTVAVCLIEKER